MAGSDTDELTSLHPDTGRIRWKVRELPIRAGTAAYIEGIAADKIVMTGSEILCLNAANGKRLWKQPVRSNVAGKGALTEDSLYVPTEDGIDRYSLQAGEPRAVLSWSAVSALRPEDRAGFPGNLLLVEGGFLTYSERVVNYFVPADKEPPKPEKPDERRDY